MTPTDKTIEMKGIGKRFGPTPALVNVNWEMRAGEIHALVGENGAGKSTMGKILAGAYAPDEGTIRFCGMPYRPASPLQARLSGVGMIYQELSLVPHLTVEENIFLGVEPARRGVLRRKEMRHRAFEVLQSLEHPEIKPEQLVKNLSLGARQLVEIGRSLAAGCRLFIFDEPTSSLSRHDVTRFFSILRELKKKNLSILYISHFLEEVEELADRFTVLRDGSVVGTYGTGSLSRGEIIRKMVGREVQELYPRSQRRRGEAILEIRDLQGIAKPKSASLTLHRGEVFGIFGLVGSGRSEFLRVLFGLAPIQEGKICIGVYTNDREHPPTPRKSWKRGMGFLSEDRGGEGIAPHLSVADNLSLSNPKGWTFSPIYPRRWNRDAGRWIARLGIRCTGPRQNILQLSGGNQQKVALARLLEEEVDILLLDEPTRGIDVGAKAQIYEMIDRIAQHKGVLLVSSYLPELLGICDRIAVMAKGYLMAPRPVADWEEHTLIAEALEEGGLP